MRGARRWGGPRGAPGGGGGGRRGGPGQSLEMEAFLARLSQLGYALEPLVQEPGQASRRGGIIDVFPPTAELPVRIEFLGRSVESLRWFDPETQRSARPCAELG